MSHTATQPHRRVTRRQREAVAKVRAWHAWQVAGGDPKQRPPRPSRSDFSIAARIDR